MSVGLVLSWCWERRAESLGSPVIEKCISSGKLTKGLNFYVLILQLSLQCPTHKIILLFHRMLWIKRQENVLNDCLGIRHLMTTWVLHSYDKLFQNIKAFKILLLPLLGKTKLVSIYMNTYNNIQANICCRWSPSEYLFLNSHVKIKKLGKPKQWSFTFLAWKKRICLCK